MKKVLSLLLVVCMCVGIAGCGGESEKDKQIAELQEENDKLKEQVAELERDRKYSEKPEPTAEATPPEAAKETPENDTRNIDKTNQSDNTSTEFKMGQPFLASTHNGSFKITIDEVQTLDAPNSIDLPEGKKVAVLVFTVENIDYGKDSAMKGIRMTENNLQMADESKTMLESYGLIPEKFQHPDAVLPGYNQKAALSYIINSNTTAVDIILNIANDIMESMHVEL